MDLFTLTRKLVDIPSVTGNEGEVGRFLTSYLEGLHYRVETQEVEQGRFNVVATTDQPARVVLSTHMDTVPPFIQSREDDENIYGRGACDAKGIIAAQISAAERLRAGGQKGIGLLFTVDEELGSKGAQVANNHSIASECRFLINGEPTDNRLAVGTKGSMRLMVTTQGRSAHSAYPEAGESAVEKLLDVLESVRESVWPADSFFGETTCNIGVIAGGTRPNVIPDHARAELQIRLGTDIDQIKEIVSQAVAGRASIEYSSAHNPIRLFVVSGLEQCIVRFTTDIPYLSNWGKPILLGPGSILDAHTEHERVSKRELEEAVELYMKLAGQLIG
jgi:acetylornithine deacetylase